MDHQFKRTSDGEPSGSSQRQRVEGQTSGGLASGQHLRFTGTAFPSAQSQEQYEVQQIVSNLEEVELIPNPQAHYAEAFSFPQDHTQNLREIEGHTPDSFASGPAGKHHLRFTRTTFPSPQHQERYEQHENTSSEVPALQQGETEYLLRLRSQIQHTNQFLQETHHRSQVVLEGLDQQIAQIQQQAGSSEVLVSPSHQRDTRVLQTSLHSPARNEQSLLQPQQEEISDLHDYLSLSSDSDHESDQRDLLEAHEAKGVAPIQSSTSHSSDAQLQKYPLDNLKQRGQIEQRQDARIQQHEGHNQAGPSCQADALNPQDREIIENSKGYIARHGFDEWQKFIANVEPEYQEAFRRLVSKLPREEQQVFAPQQAAQARKDQQDAGKSVHLRSPDQVEQGQATLPQRHEGQEQAGPHSLEKLPLPHNQAIDHSIGEIDYNKLIYFLTPEEHENLLSGLNKTHRTPKEHLAVEIFNTSIIRKQQFDDHLYIKRAIDEIRKENRYKEIYGNEEKKCQSDQESNTRIWTTQQLHDFVDDMVQIKDFDHKTFQNFLSEESKAICEQLNQYGRSFNDQEWKDIKTRFENHHVLEKDKRRKYLRVRTENSRNFQKQREIRADFKAQEEGFTNRSKKQRLNDAPEPS